MLQKAPSGTKVGYSALKDRYNLACVPDRATSWISWSRSIDRYEHPDGTVTARYPRTYQPEDTFSGHVEFALKYEGLNLQVLNALFEVAAPEVQKWLNKHPTSAYARTCGHLVEWLTGATLEFKRVPGTRRVSLLDSRNYFTGVERPDAKFSVVNNLLGTRAFCPMVRRTPTLSRWLEKSLETRITELIRNAEPVLLSRAADYLYLAETRSSWAIENERPDNDKAMRFRRLLERAGENVPLNEETFVEWQNVVVARLRMEASYRHDQNWLARPGRLNNIAEYVPPKPGDVPLMMEGLASFVTGAAEAGVPAAITAACAAFGFVFVHPFLDGNGRLHRFLLHHLLRQRGFTPPGIVVPVSLAMLSHKDAYANVLKAYSQARTTLLDYALDAENHRIRVTSPQPVGLYAYFDATELCEFVFSCLEQAIDYELPIELEYLRGYDVTVNDLNTWLDAPQSTLDLLVKLIVQNGGTLSRNKRDTIPDIDDETIRKVEAVVREKFADYWRMLHQGSTGDMAQSSRV